MCVVALILGMLMANMLKSVCGCNTVEGAMRGRGGTRGHDSRDKNEKPLTVTDLNIQPGTGDII